MYKLCSTVLVMAYYQDSVLNLLINMYKFHRLEFKKHFWKMMRLFIFTEFGLLWMCVIELLVTYEATCLKAYLKDNEAMFDDTLTEESFCPHILHYFEKFNKNTNVASMQFALYYFQLLLPVIIFLMFDDPHDCFTCIGKDPVRKYSRFQLSIEERNNRKMIARYSVNNLMSNQPLILDRNTLKLNMENESF